MNDLEKASKLCEELNEQHKKYQCKAMYSFNISRNQIEFTIFMRRGGVKTRLDAWLDEVTRENLYRELFDDLFERVPELPYQFTPRSEQSYTLVDNQDGTWNVVMITHSKRTTLKQYNDLNAAIQLRDTLSEYAHVRR